MRSIALCRWGAAVLLLLAVAAGASAYDQPLSPEAVRSAYFLGRQPEQAAESLSRYTKRVSGPSDKELNIAQVQLLTPYAQVVIASSRDMVNENSVDVDQEYEGRSLPVLVRVWFYFPSAYNSSPEEINRLEDMVQHSHVIVAQKNELHPTKTSYTGLRMPRLGRGGGWADGVEVKLEFDADDFQSAPVRISISASNGQHAETTFDLSSLK